MVQIPAPQLRLATSARQGGVVDLWKYGWSTASTHCRTSLPLYENIQDTRNSDRWVSTPPEVRSSVRPAIVKAALKATACQLSGGTGHRFRDLGRLEKPVVAGAIHGRPARKSRLSA